MSTNIGTHKFKAWYDSGALDIQNGFPCGDWNDEDVGVIHLRPFNVTEGGQIDLSKTKYIETDRALENYWLLPNDVVFNNTNSEDLVGKTAIWTITDQNVVLSNHMTRIRITGHNQVAPGFLALFLLKQWEDGYFRAVCRRHVNQASVSKDRLLDVDVPAFVFDEQRQIARVLATVQRAIEQQQAIIATTRELKRSVMHTLFTEGLRGEAQKPTEIGLVPESWDVVRLGDCCNVVSSAIPYSELEKAADYDGEDGIEVMGVKVSDMNLPGNELAFNRANLVRKMPPSLLRKRLIAAGTIVFPKRGAAIATNKKRIATGWTVLDPNLIGVVAGKLLNPDFLFLQFQRIDLRTITDPGPTPQLNKKDLLPLWLPVPSTLEEQTDIAAAIGAVQDKIDNEYAKLDLLKNLFKTLLHQLMTAQVRVHDLDLDALGVPALD